MWQIHFHFLKDSNVILKYPRNCNFRKKIWTCLFTSIYKTKEKRFCLFQTCGYYTHFILKQCIVFSLVLSTLSLSCVLHYLISFWLFGSGQQFWQKQNKAYYERIRGITATLVVIEWCFIDDILPFPCFFLLFLSFAILLLILL